MDLKNASEHFITITRHSTRSLVHTLVPFSTTTGRGIIELLKKVRRILEELPTPKTLNRQNLLKSNPRLNNSYGFYIKQIPEKIDGRRAFAVTGRQLEIFTQK